MIWFLQTCFQMLWMLWPTEDASKYWVILIPGSWLTLYVDFSWYSKTDVNVDNYQIAHVTALYNHYFHLSPQNWEVIIYNTQHFPAEDSCFKNGVCSETSQTSQDWQTSTVFSCVLAFNYFLCCSCVLGMSAKLYFNF